jgi:hypothetical protein
VLPEVARSAAEAAARLLPRGGQQAEPQLSGRVSAHLPPKSTLVVRPKGDWPGHSGGVPVGLEPTTYGLVSRRLVDVGYVEKSFDRNGFWIVQRWSRLVVFDHKVIIKVIVGPRLDRGRESFEGPPDGYDDPGPREKSSKTHRVRDTRTTGRHVPRTQQLS